ncbi:SHC-transforming protein 3 [Oryzias melastigma]|nr:SHC-transforming protein 3 [Oryzias melastigma]XP_036073364.1 SHC-transforming protein 3 [Oryzias melastigma]XP_036073366.1 SHC-transforming protein 3 [Oryzias melastigma]
MKEQTRLGSQPGLFPGMLKRTKYSRLRNDSLTSLEDHPQRMVPLKRDLCLDSDFAGTSSHCGPSTLGDYIPHVDNTQHQSPTCQQKSRLQPNTAGDKPARGHSDKPLDGNFSNCLIHPALLCTKRPITLHRMASLPCPSCSQHRDHLCCLKPSSATDDWTGDRAVHHHVKYMGSVEVTQSMRTLDFDTRMQVTREAISRLCEKTSVKTAVKTKRAASKGPSAVLGEINMQFSGSRVILTVSTNSVTLMAASTLQRIAHHPMQAISFASGGDPDMTDYVAYVAKDLFNKRACHILECPHGRASEVLNSIGQAFETRFRQLLSQTSTLLSTRSALRICPKRSPEETTCLKGESDVSVQPDYYNVNPAKDLPLYGNEAHKQNADKQEVSLSPPVSLYENCSVSEDTPAPPAGASPQPAVSDEQWTPLSDGRDRSLLVQKEGWFHGRLGREQAESLLTCSGDFLVRESSSASGQYVLSGMEGATVRHLLLVDPHGQVRTRDLVFQSVGHLVRFHMEKQLPIISGSSELCLKQPILQTH